MEQDRDASNVAPTPLETSSPHSSPLSKPQDEPQPAHDPTPASASKTPRRKVVGRRTAQSLASSKPADTQSANIEESAASLSLTTPAPPRQPRTLHSIPESILHDPEINQAITTYLPPNYNFEIHKTIHRIRTCNARTIALQFPEGLLMFGPLISDILTGFCPGTDTVIMGDVTYGACCIDDFTARALGADLLVHYGHSCLVPLRDTGKDGLQVLYVFVTIGVETDHLLKTITRNFEPARCGRIALVGTIQFNNTLHATIPRLKSQGYDVFLPRSKPLSAGEILGCTAPSLGSGAGTANGGKPDQRADMILYVGDGRFHLESIMIASPALRRKTYRYDPYSRRLTHETYAHDEMHSLRSHAIGAARRTLAPSPPPSPSPSPSPPSTAHPKGWGLILGTLGRQGNPSTLALLEQHLLARGVPYVTVLLSEVSPAKLGLMGADVGVWVQVACPRLSVDWGYAFERPLLSAYEGLVALGVRDGEAAWLRGGLDAGDGVGGFDGPDEVRGDGGDVATMPELYPMDYYAVDGLGRVKPEDVPRDLHVKSRSTEVH